MIGELDAPKYRWIDAMWNLEEKEKKTQISINLFGRSVSYVANIILIIDETN